MSIESQELHKNSEDESKKEDVRLIMIRAHNIISCLNKEEKNSFLKLPPITKEKLLTIKDLLEDIEDKFNRDNKIVESMKNHSSFIHEVGNLEVVLSLINKLNLHGEKNKKAEDINRVINEKINYFFDYLSDIVKDEESFKKAITLEDWPFEEAA